MRSGTPGEGKGEVEIAEAQGRLSSERVAGQTGDIVRGAGGDRKAYEVPSS